MVVNALNNNTFLFSKTGLMVVKALNNAILLLNFNILVAVDFQQTYMSPLKSTQLKCAVSS